MKNSHETGFKHLRPLRRLLPDLQLGRLDIFFSRQLCQTRVSCDLGMDLLYFKLLLLITSSLCFTFLLPQFTRIIHSSCSRGQVSLVALVSGFSVLVLSGTCVVALWGLLGDCCKFRGCVLDCSMLQCVNKNNNNNS